MSVFIPEMQIMEKLSPVLPELTISKILLPKLFTLNYQLHQGRLTVELLTDELTNRRAKNDHFSTLRRHFCPGYSIGKMLIFVLIQSL